MSNRKNSEVSTEEVKSTTGVTIIIDGCNDLNVEELKAVIEHCANRIQSIQREEVEILESQMREIQDRLVAIKGKDSQTKSMSNRRATTPIVNPDDPRQVYTLGKVPDWLNALMARTGKTVQELRSA